MSSEPLNPAQFRKACARFATGVAVVTVFAPDGTPHGLTVNSFTSLSLTPPLVLVAIDERCNLLTHFLARREFAVNVLRDSQRNLSVRFSSCDDRFEGVPWRRASAPILQGALAVFECVRQADYPAGDHRIVVGEVKHAAFEQGLPLLFYNSAYALLAAAPADADRAADNAAS